MGMGQAHRIVGNNERGACADQVCDRRARDRAALLDKGPEACRPMRSADRSVGTISGGSAPRELVGKIGFDLVQNRVDTAVELHAGPIQMHPR